MNVNNFTPCLPATAEDGSVPVKPVCMYTSIGSVVHFFVEAAGATRQNVTIKVNREAMEFIIEAVVQREHRADRRYYARIRLLHTTVCEYSYENMGWDVSNGEIHVWFPFKSIDQSFRFPLILGKMNNNNQPQQQQPNPNVRYERTKGAQKIWINTTGTNLRDVRAQMDFSTGLCNVNGVAHGGGDQFPMAIPVPSGFYDQEKMKFGFRGSLILLNLPFSSDEPVKLRCLEF